MNALLHADLYKDALARLNAGGRNFGWCVPRSLSSNARSGQPLRTTPQHCPQRPAVLDAYIGERTGPLFVTRTGLRLTRTAAYRLLQRLAHKADIAAAGEISPHSTRHAFATLALDAGVPLRDVQDAMGHSDPRTTRRYDRSRHSLDRHATYAVAAYLDGR